MCTHKCKRSTQKEVAESVCSARERRLFEFYTKSRNRPTFHINLQQANNEQTVCYLRLAHLDIILPQSTRSPGYHNSLGPFHCENRMTWILRAEMDCMSPVMMLTKTHLSHLFPQGAPDWWHASCCQVRTRPRHERHHSGLVATRGNTSPHPSESPELP